MTSPLDPGVRAAFPAWTARFEGRIPWLYLDVRGLVTAGLGCLLDPVDMALPLPWRWRADGCPATQNEIRADWSRIKAATALAHEGAAAAGRVALLELAGDAIDALALTRLDADVGVLVTGLPDLPSWPAPAQQAACGLAWAVGAGWALPGGGWPHLRAACLAQNWAGAADNCRISEAGNPGVRARNEAQRALFLAAAGG